MPRQVMRWTMAGFYTLAGVVHITAPDKFLSLERSNLAKIDVVSATASRCKIVGYGGADVFRKSATVRG
ncbi:MAG: hypothetical protein WA439_12835 [Pseudolabrys sp.]